MSDLKEEEIRVFVDAVTHYFTQLTTDRPQVRGAYLGAGDVRPPSLGFSGLIPISGGFQGSVYVSAPRAMLRHLLVTAQEPSQSDENLLDLVGEVANTIAGNARRYFGERMEIAVPVTIAGHADTIRPRCRTRPYIVTVEWKGYTAQLVVDIDRRE